MPPFSVPVVSWTRATPVMAVRMVKGARRRHTSRDVITKIRISESAWSWPVGPVIGGTDSASTPPATIASVTSGCRRSQAVNLPRMSSALRAVKRPWRLLARSSRIIIAMRLANRVPWSRRRNRR
jgi:hypothetical protein